MKNTIIFHEERIFCLPGGDFLNPGAVFSREVNQVEGGKKYITVGRHQYTQYQANLLKQAGLEHEVARIQNVNNPKEVIEKAKEAGASSIVVQTLPLPLLVQLVQLAQRENINVYQFQMDYANARITNDCNECQENEVCVPAREGGVRCVPVAGLYRVRNIVVNIDSEKVAP